MPDPSTLQIPEKELVAVFVEIPYASKLPNSFFICLDESHACQKMKQVFPSLVRMTNNPHKCKIYEWVSSMALLHNFINFMSDSSSLHMSWKMMLHVQSGMSTI
jgi:hypothetical protein